MAYVVPNTTVKLLHNIYLDNGYEHTAYFSSLSDQTNYFTGSDKVKYTLNNQMYQRQERGWLKVNLAQENVIDCNYMMFKNTGYSNKWFYAFILSVEYVNDATCRIRYEIDVIQTWYFNYTLEPCFVEREHTYTDAMFSNIVEENLDLGPFYTVRKSDRYDLDCTLACALATGHWSTATDQYVANPPVNFANYCTGAKTYCFDLKTAQGRSDIKDFLQEYIEHGIEDGIITIYQYPRFIGELPVTPIEGETLAYASDSYYFPPDFSAVGSQTKSYTPVNKKLYTYPFNFLECDNGVGDTSVYKFEAFDTYGEDPNTHAPRCLFRIIGTPLGVPTCLMHPLYYAGEQYSYQYGLTISCDIQISWTGDAYMIWLARNEKNIALQKTKTGVGIALGAAGMIAGGAMAASGIPVGMGLVRAGGGLVAGGAYSLWQTIDSKVTKKNETDATPDPVHGQISNSLLNTVRGVNQYTFRQKSVTAEYAEIIDKYFSKFGYACHKVKTPSTHNRTKWTYTKTVGCEAHGNMPNDDLDSIKRIFDNGITFWTEPNYIGDYNHYLWLNVPLGDV